MSYVNIERSEKELRREAGGILTAVKQAFACLKGSWHVNGCEEVNAESAVLGDAALHSITRSPNRHHPTRRFWNVLQSIPDGYRFDAKNANAIFCQIVRGQSGPGATFSHNQRCLVLVKRGPRPYWSSHFRALKGESPLSERGRIACPPIAASWLLSR